MILDMDSGASLNMYYHGVYEPETTAFLASHVREGDVFIDVGANIGYHSLIAGERGAKIHAFEPVSWVARILEENLSRNNIEAEVHQMAVSNQDGEATFFETRISTRSSLYPQGGTRSIRKVPTVRLDSIFDHIDILKVDVEGAEHRVLEGLGDLIHDFRWLIVEFRPQHGSTSRIVEMLHDWNARGLDQNMLFWR